jgi:hypothetical protein
MAGCTRFRGTVCRSADDEALIEALDPAVRAAIAVPSASESRRLT